ncbi:MAG: caspase family protein [Salaquimonas sp.]|nr:caspase family protein [Salaquimonas sp.]
MRPWTVSLMLLAALFVAAITGACEASASQERRVALVIGNSAYENVPELPNPRNDAEAISAALTRLDFEVIEGLDLKRPQLVDKIRQFARQMRGADIALLFYAGHGLQVGGRNYLVPVDTELLDEADLEFETVPLDVIMAQMEREPRTNLIFLDACRNNPLARNLARSMGTRSAGVGRGLAPIESGVGTLIAFATQPGNVALDGDNGNSPFTSALIKHIETPGEDIAVVLRKVRQDVIDETDGRQVPWGNSSLTGSVILKRGNKPPIADNALQKQLEEMRQRLEEAEKKLRGEDNGTKVAAKAETSSAKSPDQGGPEKSSTAADNPAAAPAADTVAAGNPTPEKQELEVASLPSSLSSPSAGQVDGAKAPAETSADVGEADAASRDLQIARRVNSPRTWQLFLRRHGSDASYAEQAIASIDPEAGGDGTAARDLESVIGLNRETRTTIQQTLASQGITVGAPDGVFGPMTRNAITKYQQSVGLPATGYVDPALLRKLGVALNMRDDGDFTSGSLAKSYAADELEQLGEEHKVAEAFRCLQAETNYGHYIYGRYKGRYYIAVNELKQHTSAAQFKEMAKKCGGSLATIASAAINEFLYDMIDESPDFFRTGSDGKWDYKSGPIIGLVKTGNYASPKVGWHWDSGEKSNYRNWFPGQPDNGSKYVSYTGFVGVAKKGTRDPAKLRADKWNDTNDLRNGFIMQLD